MNPLKDATISDWTAGKVLAERYILLEEIGGDGATSLYRAEKSGTGEPCLVRALSGNLTDDPMMAREFREISDLVLRARHPSLPPVETLGEAEGRPFLVTGPADGPTLADLIQTEGRIAPARACVIAGQIAAALEAAHRLGLLHLGLEPRQIIVSAEAGEERVTVNGFGAAHLRMSRARRGRSAPLGAGRPLSLKDLLPAAPAYAAPEAVLAKSPESLDGRADLYALGVLTYQMLMGHLPAVPTVPDDDGLETLVTQLESPAEPLQIDPDIPESLARLVRQLLEKRPELRPSTAKVVSEAVDRAAREPFRVAAAPERSRADPLLEPVPQISREEALQSAPTPEPEVVHEPAEVFSEFPLEVPPAFEPAPPLVLRPGGRAIPGTPAAAGPVALPVDTGQVPLPFGSPTSILFKTQPAPQPPAEWGRRALAVLVVVLVAAAALFFIGESKKLQWSSLTPTAVDDEHSLSKPDSGAAAAPTAPKSAPPPATAPAQSQPESPAPSGASVQESTAARQPPDGASAGIANRGSQPSSGPGTEAVAEEVRRAVSAGDVFYQLGQYDLAIQTYQGPLKDDPKNQTLLSRIERARKAKAAEQEYLGP